MDFQRDFRPWSSWTRERIVKIGLSNDDSNAGFTVDGTSTDSKRPRGASGLSVTAVGISDLTARLTAADSNISANIPFDVKKVEDIKAAISCGTFRVNTDTVANKLIVHARESWAGQKAR